MRDDSESPIMSASEHLVLLSIISLVFVFAVHLVRTLYRNRFRRYAHFPQLPTSILGGHLGALDGFYRSRELDRHPDYLFTDISDALGHPPVIFLNLWPVDFKLALVTSHEIAEQVSKASKLLPWSVPKPPGITSLRHLIGDHSPLLGEGPEWKALRKRSNPGFAPQHVATLLPRLVDKLENFVGIIDRAARARQEVSLGDLTANLTFDVIGAVVLGLDMDAQKDTNQSQFFQLYKQLLMIYKADLPRYLPSWLLPRTKLKRYRLVREIDLLLKEVVQQRFEAQSAASSRTAKRRDILSLSQQNANTLTPEILQDTADQLKTLLFTGWDTTSVALSWIFYELSRTPRALQAVRSEIDAIFGPETSSDPWTICEKLRSSDGEELIYQMPYITAVIKETLRLYPPASTGRMSPPGTGFTVHSKEGGEYCLDGLIIYNCARAIQRDPAVYGDNANDFVPERWLSESNAIPPSTWRPFERGPWNCIGQELAMVEARVVVAAVSREFDFIKIGVGEVCLDAKGLPLLQDNGQYRVHSELNNTGKVTARPVDGMRMKVRSSIASQGLDGAYISER